MGTENSSADTRNRAKALAEAIGSYHIDLNMDTIVTAVRTLFTTVTGLTPRFRVHGGSNAENLALQNIQVDPSWVVEYTNSDNPLMTPYIYFARCLESRGC